MELSAEVLNKTFLYCLFKEGEDTTSHIIGEGVIQKFGFHPERLKESTPTIIGLIDELPSEFRKDGGGGWSFMNMCIDKHGNQWADSHPTIEELLTLGIAIGKIQYQLPRELWSSLPGGMPYIVILPNPEEPEYTLTSWIGDKT